MFDKIKAGNKKAWEAHFCDNFTARSIAHDTTYGKAGVLEHEATAETETKLVCQELNATEEGQFPVMDVWTHDGSEITACDFLFRRMAEINKKPPQSISAGG